MDFPPRASTWYDCITKINIAEHESLWVRSNPIRGNMLHSFCSMSVPLCVPLSYIESLPLEQWNMVWFDAANPRGFLPLATLTQLVPLASKMIKTWDGGFESILCGPYVWLPSLACAIDRLSPEAVIRLCISTWGGEYTGTAHNNPNYSTQELAILRENLFRWFGKIDDVVRVTFSQASDERLATERQALTTHLQETLYRLLWMRIDGSTDSFGRPSKSALSRIVEQGLLCHACDGVDHFVHNTIPMCSIMTSITGGTHLWPEWLAKVVAWTG
jgi:hypothetical protein